MHELFFGYFKSIFTLTVLVAHFGHNFNLPFDSLYIDLSSIQKKLCSGFKQGEKQMKKNNQITWNLFFFSVSLATFRSLEFL